MECRDLMIAHAPAFRASCWCFESMSHFPPTKETPQHSACVRLLTTMLSQHGKAISSSISTCQVRHADLRAAQSAECRANDSQFVVFVFTTIGRLRSFLGSTEPSSSYCFQLQEVQAMHGSQKSKTITVEDLKAHALHLILRKIWVEKWASRSASRV